MFERRKLLAGVGHLKPIKRVKFSGFASVL
jgi:hypothetical protein